MQDIIKEIVRKSRKDKSIANQKIEIGQTSIERPQLIAAITTEDEKTDDKILPLQMLQKRQKGTKQIASKKKKNLKSSVSMYFIDNIFLQVSQTNGRTTLPYEFLCISLYCYFFKIFF